MEVDETRKKSETNKLVFYSFCEIIVIVEFGDKLASGEYLCLLNKSQMAQNKWQ